MRFQELCFGLVGYNLAYGIPEGGYIGTFMPWSDASAIDTGYSDGSDWFFQMVFCATTVSICSGAMAERVKTVAVLFICSNFSWSDLSNRHGLAVGWRLVSFFRFF